MAADMQKSWRISCVIPRCNYNALSHNLFFKLIDISVHGRKENNSVSSLLQSCLRHRGANSYRISCIQRVILQSPSVSLLSTVSLSWEKWASLWNESFSQTWIILSSCSPAHISIFISALDNGDRKVFLVFWWDNGMITQEAGGGYEIGKCNLKIDGNACNCHSARAIVRKLSDNWHFQSNTGLRLDGGWKRRETESEL